MLLKTPGNSVFELDGPVLTPVDSIFLLSHRHELRMVCGWKQSDAALSWHLTLISLGELCEFTQALTLIESKSRNLCSQQPWAHQIQYLPFHCIDSYLHKRKWTKLEGICIRAAVCMHLLLVLTLTPWAFLLAFAITSLHHGPSV